LRILSHVHTHVQIHIHAHKHGCTNAHAQVSDWADVIYDFVRTYGLTDSVMVVDELSSGDDVAGTGTLASMLQACSKHVPSMFQAC
jgi:hypothetical protein